MFEFHHMCPSCGNRTVDNTSYNTSTCCPERIQQPKFPSANSTFPPEELAEVNECIEQANELLLAIGVDNEGEVNLRSFQLTVRKMKGQFLSVKVQCGEKRQRIKGVLKEAGLNFIVLETEVKNLVIIPTERVLSMKHSDERPCSNILEEELLCIDENLRLDLMLHFSEVVSRSPFLVNLFFGLKLELFLESFIGCVIYTKSDSDKREVEGTLTKVDHRKIEFLNMDEEKQGIDFDELCYIEVERQAFSGLTLFRE
ncbi:hypothetical protein FZW96_15120 [Bacillus sp. BGMRC 2118]|nr:hypothetical protein FZW96_15120 [Bacillus sp. BGMRC 2118]